MRKKRKKEAHEVLMKLYKSTKDKNPLFYSFKILFHFQLNTKLCMPTTIT